MKTAKRATRVHKSKDEKFEDFKQALVDKYGKNTIVTYAQLAHVYESGDYAKWRDYAKNPAYKIARNRFIVTTSNDPASIRDRMLERLRAKQKALKSKRKALPKTEKRRGRPPKATAWMRQQTPMATHRVH